MTQLFIYTARDSKNLLYTVNNEACRVDIGIFGHTNQ